MNKIVSDKKIVNAQCQYIAQVETKVGFLRIYANTDGVSEIRFFEQEINERPNDVCIEAKKQLKAYLQGRLHRFELPLAPQGTDFQKRVWQQLLKVPYGKTASYLDIANALSKPTACRAVGAANGKNPISIVIPCHRVIGSNGKLTGYAGGLPRKTFLLNLEADNSQTAVI